MKSIVSPKGQVTLPKELREGFGLTEGTPVEFLPKRNGVLIRKSTTGQHPVDQVFGILRLKKSVDRLIDEMRGGRVRHQ